MKKAGSEHTKKNDSDILPEYDFTGAVRGRAYRPLHLGYTIKIHKADGTTEIQEVKPRKRAVILDPDVQAYFPNSKSVNAALRSLIKLIPNKRPQSTRSTKRISTKRALA
jgi:hypothetical protein